MPVSAAPSSRSTRNTNASDHTAVRRVEAADGDEHGDVGDAADRGGERRPGPALAGAGDDRGQRGTPARA